MLWAARWHCRHEVSYRDLTGGTARPVVAARIQAARATGMPNCTAFSTRLSLMPEHGEGDDALGQQVQQFVVAPEPVGRCVRGGSNPACTPPGARRWPPLTGMSLVRSQKVVTGKAKGQRPGGDATARDPEGTESCQASVVATLNSHSNDVFCLASSENCTISSSDNSRSTTIRNLPKLSRRSPISCSILPTFSNSVCEPNITET